MFFKQQKLFYPKKKFKGVGFVLPVSLSTVFVVWKVCRISGEAKVVHLLRPRLAQDSVGGVDGHELVVNLLLKVVARDRVDARFAVLVFVWM